MKKLEKVFTNAVYKSCGYWYNLHNIVCISRFEIERQVCGMYFVIQNGSIEETDESTWTKSEDAIGIFTSEEWKKELDGRTDYYLDQRHENIHFCKLESHAEYLFGTLRIPEKENPRRSIGFAFYILNDKIIFIDDSDTVRTSVQSMAETKRRREYSMERFLYDLLISLIEDDLIHLESVEKEISKMEEAILVGEVEDFNSKMLIIKKKISTLYRYYTQLTDVGEGLAENEMEFFGKDDVATFIVFTERAERLQSEAQVLREYAMQVQDVYQSEMSIRQNDVMKVLTIVTTIFLPLTLIVGWYGMNFKYMPELGWKLGYPMVVLLCIFVILIGIWIFKKKKFW